MNNIVIGQYVPRDSWLHRLDPRYKLVTLVLMLASLFIIPVRVEWPYLATLGGLTLINILLIATSKVPIMSVLKGFRPVMFLLTFTFIIQIFYYQVDPTATLVVPEIKLNFTWASIGAIILILAIYFLTKKYIKFKFIYFLIMVFGLFAVQYFIPSEWGLIAPYSVKLYDEALIRSGFLVLRILNVIILTSLLTLTTMTTDLNHGIESLLKPLKVIKFPVDTLAMMLSLTLRYIPTLLEETNKIMKAQASRGVDFKEGRLKDKIMQMVSLLVPVFIISFKRAEDLSNAMEARGYEIGAKRTKIDEYKTKRADIISLIVTSLILCAIIVGRILL
ncbi:MAG: energy-coupling factor transporter transmembrane component T family protein [Acholeplasmataceae bacterium]|jgi:energy-coupling factor transport system permease protein